MQNFSFAGHQTFPFRQLWPYKAFILAQHKSKLPTVEDQITFLGIGKNMIDALKFWAKTCDLYDQKYNLSDFAKTIFALDPYCENINTSFLLHYKASSNEKKLSALYFLFNIFKQNNFTLETLYQEFENFLKQQIDLGNLKRLPSKNTVRKDLDTVLKTYAFNYDQHQKFKNKQPTLDLSENGIDSIFKELNLIESNNSHYKLIRSAHTDLKTEIFGYCLIDYLESNHTSYVALDFNKICYGLGSPGQCFKLDEESITNILSKLTIISQNKLMFKDQTGIRQVLIIANHSELSTLKQDLLQKAYQA